MDELCVFSSPSASKLYKNIPTVKIVKLRWSAPVAICHAGLENTLLYGWRAVWIWSEAVSETNPFFFCTKQHSELFHSFALCIACVSLIF